MHRYTGSQKHETSENGTSTQGRLEKRKPVCSLFDHASLSHRIHPFKNDSFYFNVCVRYSRRFFTRIRGLYCIIMNCQWTPETLYTGRCLPVPHADWCGALIYPICRKFPVWRDNLSCALYHTIGLIYTTTQCILYANIHSFSRIRRELFLNIFL